MLTLLVSSVLMSLTANASPPLEQSLEGRWGGDRMVLTIHQGAGTVDLECASGTIQGPIKLTAKGRFEAKGSFEQSRGGPQRVEEAPSAATARYTGTLKGHALKLEVLPAPGEPVQVFNLRKGAQVKMVRCF
jgi:hypothetical protein